MQKLSSVSTLKTPSLLAVAMAIALLPIIALPYLGYTKMSPKIGFHFKNILRRQKFGTGISISLFMKRMDGMRRRCSIGC